MVMQKNNNSTSVTKRKQKVNGATASASGNTNESHVALDCPELAAMGEDAQELARIVIRLVTSRISSQFEERIANMEEKIKAQKETIETLTAKIDKQEEYGDQTMQDKIKDTLVLSGEVAPFTAEENCAEIVVQTLRDKLQVNIQSSEITEAARIGARKPEGEVDKRPIKFKFKSRGAEQRKDLTTACCTYKPKIYINELMTPYKRDLFNKVKKVKREHPSLIKKCYVSEGKIVIKKLTPEGRNHRINSEKDLNRYLHEFRYSSISHG